MNNTTTPSLTAADFAAHAAIFTPLPGVATVIALATVASVLSAYAGLFTNYRTPAQRADDLDYSRRHFGTVYYHNPNN